MTWVVPVDAPFPNPPAPTLKVPPLMFVVPVKLFVPVRTQVPGPLLVTATPPAVVPFPIMPLIVLFPVLEPFKVNVIDEVVVPPVIPPPKVNTLVDEDALLVKEYDPEVTELAGASEIGALIVSLFATALVIWMVPLFVKTNVGPPVVPIVNAPTEAVSKVMLWRFRVVPPVMRLGLRVMVGFPPLILNVAVSVLVVVFTAPGNVWFPVLQFELGPVCEGIQLLF